MNSEFLNILNEMEQCRINSFVRPALFMSLSIIDTCAKVEYPNKKVGERYKQWSKEFLYNDWLAYAYGFISINDWLNYAEPEIQNLVKSSSDDFAKELYVLRCNLLHETDIEIKNNGKRLCPLRTYIISPMSSCSAGVAIFKTNEPYGYKPVDIGILIIQIYRVAKTYYENCNMEKRKILDNKNAYFVDERNDNYAQKLWTIEKLNNRKDGK